MKLMNLSETTRLVRGKVEFGTDSVVLLTYTASNFYTLPRATCGFGSDTAVYLLAGSVSEIPAR